MLWWSSRCSSYPRRIRQSHSSQNLDYKLPMNMLLVQVLLLLRVLGVLLFCTMEKFHSTDTCSHDTNSHNSRNHGYSIVLLHCNIVLLFLLLFCSSHSDRSRTTHSSQYCHQSHSILLTLHIPELGLLLVVAVLRFVAGSGHHNTLLQTHSNPNRGCSDRCIDHRLDNTLLGSVSLPPSLSLLFPPLSHLLHEYLIHK